MSLSASRCASSDNCETRGDGLSNARLAIYWLLPRSLDVTARHVVNWPSTNLSQRIAPSGVFTIAPSENSTPPQIHAFGDVDCCGLQMAGLWVLSLATAVAARLVFCHEPCTQTFLGEDEIVPICNTVLCGYSTSAYRQALDPTDVDDCWARSVGCCRKPIANGTRVITDASAVSNTRRRPAFAFFESFDIISSIRQLRSDPEMPDAPAITCPN